MLTNIDNGKESVVLFEMCFFRFLHEYFACPPDIQSGGHVRQIIRIIENCDQNGDRVSKNNLDGAHDLLSILSDLKKQLPCCEIYCHLKPNFFYLVLYWLRAVHKSILFYSA